MNNFKNLKDLLEHNRKCAAARQMKKDLAKEPATVEIIEETPHIEEAIPEIKEELPEEIHEEENLIEEEGEKEETKNDEVTEAEEKPVSKKKGRKPANREYMVVENIEDVNND